MNGRYTPEEYQAMLSRQMVADEVSAGGIIDEAGTPGPGVVPPGRMPPATLGRAQPAPPSDIKKVADTASVAGGLNPYVAGAGVALQGVAMVDAAKRNQEQGQIDAYNKKIMAQRAAVRNMFG